MRLPDVAAFEPPQGDIASGTTFPDAAFSVPSPGMMPVQETGVRPARPLPYTLQVDAAANVPAQTITVNFDNDGKAGACVHVRSPDGSSAGGSTGPWSYTVEACKSLFDTWTPGDDGSYELTVNGPNGFFRKFAGAFATGAVDLTVVASYDASGIALRITNNTTANVPLDVTDTTHTNEMRSKDLAPGDTVGLHFWLPPNHNWYDLIVTTSADADFVRQCAGHVQNGEPSISDPKMAQVPPRRHIHGGGGGPEVHRDEGQSRAERSRGPGYRK